MKAPECTSHPIIPISSSASPEENTYTPISDTAQSVTEIFRRYERMTRSSSSQDSTSLRNDYAWDPMERLPLIPVWTGRETIDLTTVSGEPHAETDGMNEPSSSSEQIWTRRENGEILPTNIRIFIPLLDDDATHCR